MPGAPDDSTATTFRLLKHPLVLPITVCTRRLLPRVRRNVLQMMHRRSHAPHWSAQALVTLAGIAAFFVNIGIGALLARSESPRWQAAVVVAGATLSLAAWLRSTFEARQLASRTEWLEGTLDAVPQLISVSDPNMHWVFVNRAAETLLGKTRDQVRGQHCSQWGTEICDTAKCGVTALRAGCAQNSFVQPLPDGTRKAMQVDTSYIHDRHGNVMGHVEIISDMQAKHDLETVHGQVASAIQRVNGAIGQVNRQTQANVESARQASIRSAESRTTAATGHAEMNRLRAAMTEMRAASDNIVRVNKGIDEIAFQTNVLALNAAVEAARAGAAGAGFAVVADEVRNLATRAADAAREANELIGNSARAVQEGGRLVDIVGGSLGAVDAAAAEVDELLRSITDASAEQARGIANVADTLATLERDSASSGATTPAGGVIPMSSLKRGAA
jgi:methyl-accepting chemotaxis protein